MNTPALPAFLQQRQSKALAADLSGNLGMGSPPYISIMGNRFTLLDSSGAEEPVQTYTPQLGPYLDCVIIDNGKHISKVFYDRPFDPNASQYEAPACWSDNGIGPSRGAQKPQSPTCAACPNNAWGSKVSTVSGKQVKACSDMQKLAILIPGDDVIFLLRVPPNSLSTLRAYNQKFIGQKVDVSDVITRISFEQGQIGQLKFDAVAFIDEAVFAKREQALLEHRTDQLVGHTDLPRQDALPAPQQPTAAALPSPQPVAPFQPAPQQPFTAPAAAPMAAAQPVQPQALAAPTAGEQPARQRRQRRTAAPAQQPNPAPQPVAAQPAPVAPFRTVAPAPAPNGGAPANFGMSAPAGAPPADVNAALDNLFGKPQG